MQSTVVHLRVTKQPCYNTCIHQQEQDAAAFGNLKFMQQSVIFCSALRVNFVVSIGNSLCCQTACAVPCPSLSLLNKQLSIPALSFLAILTLRYMFPRMH